jgi:hypothetical protein
MPNYYYTARCGDPEHGRAVIQPLVDARVKNVAPLELLLLLVVVVLVLVVVVIVSQPVPSTDPKGLLPIPTLIAIRTTVQPAPPVVGGRAGGGGG